MKCDACLGRGYRLSNVTGREQDCTVCLTSGFLEMCDLFDPGITIGPFRNNRCIQCNVRQNDHGRSHVSNY